MSLYIVLQLYDRIFIYIEILNSSKNESNLETKGFVIVTVLV